MTPTPRRHLTIHEKNALRAFRRLRPDLTQEQLREWAHEQFGKWLGRSTVGKIASSPDEVCANPDAKRNQGGRFPDMERELFTFVTQSTDLSESVLWTKANEILKRLHGEQQSVSMGWVQRFKKRHGLHRSQRELQSAGLYGAHGNELSVVTETQSEFVRNKRPRQEEDQATSSVPPVTTTRKQFVAADDVILLTEVLNTKPWTFVQEMDGWQQVAVKLRVQLDKTAGACQARVTLLLDHLRAGNFVALRKSGTEDEFKRKHALLIELQQTLNARDDEVSGEADETVPSSVTQHDAAVAKVGQVAATVAAAEASGLADYDAQRRMELLEIRMERELAEQRRHADEQVQQLQRLQRTQLKMQQNQHAQLLTTIQQQQTMMLDLIKSVSSVQQAQAKKKINNSINSNK